MLSLVFIIEFHAIIVQIQILMIIKILIFNTFSSKIHFNILNKFIICFLNILITILWRTKALCIIFRQLVIYFLIKLDIIKQMILAWSILLIGDLQAGLALRMVWFLHLADECRQFSGTWCLMLRIVCNLLRHIKVCSSWRREHPAIKRTLTDLTQIRHWHWLVWHWNSIHQVLHFILVLVIDILV